MAWAGYSFLHIKFRIWTKRLNLCLNLRPQLGHAWRGSWPHSTLMCRHNESYSWYILQHLGHTNKLLSCCVVSVPCALWFWCLLDKMEAKTPTSVPRLYSPSNSTETATKITVSTLLARVTYNISQMLNQLILSLLGMRFSQWWLGRVQSSGLSCCVVHRKAKFFWRYIPPTSAVSCLAYCLTLKMCMFLLKCWAFQTTKCHNSHVHLFYTWIYCWQS